jgi:hypothetical protein
MYPSFGVAAWVEIGSLFACPALVSGALAHNRGIQTVSRSATLGHLGAAFL